MDERESTRAQANLIQPLTLEFGLIQYIENIDHCDPSDHEITVCHPFHQTLGHPTIAINEAFPSYKTEWDGEGDEDPEPGEAGATRSLRVWLPG